METENNMQAHILIEVDQAIVHRFVGKYKTLYTQGVCKIAEISNPSEASVYFLNINSFYYTLTKSVTFAKIQFEDTVSYLFSHFNHGLSTITLPKNNEVIGRFEEIISKIIILKNFDVAIHEEEFFAKVQENCPNIEKEPIVNNDKIKQAIMWTGKKLETGVVLVGDYFTKGVHFIGEYIYEKVDEPINKPQVGPIVKEKVQTLKNGTKKAACFGQQMYSKYLAPWIKTGLEYGKLLDSRIESSDYGKIKYVRDLVCTSGKALNCAFSGLSCGTKKVLCQLECQTRKIVKKRLGDDYVKTFLPIKKKEEGTTLTEVEQSKSGSEQPKQTSI